MDSRLFFTIVRHIKTVAILTFLCVFFCVLTGCTYTPIESDEDPLENENVLKIDIEIENYQYEVGVNVKIPFQVNDGEDKHYIDGYKFEFVNNSASATGSWVKRNDGSNLYDYFVVATKEGQTDFIATYQYKNGKKYSSDKITLIFEYTKISTVDELIAIANTSKNYKLVNDIDLKSYANWAPITGFKGKLYGQNFAIDNLKITSSNGDNVGLFSSLEGEVYDLIMRNVEINLSSAYQNVGALAGSSSKNIHNVRVTGKVDAPFYKNVGGLVGLVKSGSITQNSNASEITGLDYVGGLFGKVEKGYTTFTNNLNIGSIEGKGMVGGIAGFIDISQLKTIDSNLNEGTINATGNDVGGLVGQLGATISGYQSGLVISFNNNENKGIVETTGSYVGGLIGRQLTKNTSTTSSSNQLYLTVVSAKNSGSVTGDSYVGGVIGFGSHLSALSLSQNTASITGTTYVGGYVGRSSHVIITGAINDQTITGTTYVGGIAGYAKQITDSTNTGDILSLGVTFDGSTPIAYVGGLVGYGFGITNSTNDADIRVDTQGVYVGGLAGAINTNNLPTLDGNTNKGDISSTGNYVGGLYGGMTASIESYDTKQVAIITNNTNQGSVSSTGNYVGGIVGYQISNNSSTSGLSYQNFTSIMNSTNTGTITGMSYVGGMIGYGKYIKDMHYNSNTGNITGQHYVGGYAGKAEQAYISQVQNTVNITGSTYVGGIAGYARIIENAENLGNINSIGVQIEGTIAVSYVGGIAGYVFGISNSTNHSDISITTQGAYVGGLVGYINASELPTITRNLNKGKVESNGDFVGGIVGAIMSSTKSYDSNQTISFSYNENQNHITSTGDYVGGLIGYQKSSNSSTTSITYQQFINISNSINSGNVTGDLYVGGILGYGTYTFGATSIWNTNINEGSISGNNHVGNQYGYIKNTK